MDPVSNTVITVCYYLLLLLFIIINNYPPRWRWLAVDIYLVFVLVFAQSVNRYGEFQFYML